MPLNHFLAKYVCAICMLVELSTFIAITFTQQELLQPFDFLIKLCRYLLLSTLTLKSTFKYRSFTFYQKCRLSF